MIHNVDVSEHPEAPAIRRVLTEQLYRPVRWTETVQRLGAHGVDTLIELGPGKVLSGLARRIDGNLPAAPTTDVVSLNKALEQTGTTP